MGDRAMGANGVGGGGGGGGGGTDSYRSVRTALLWGPPMTL